MRISDWCSDVCSSDLQKRPDLALAVAERMKTQFPDRISGDTLLGIAYLSTRDIDKAHEAFARAVEREPEDPAAAGNLVNILVIEGKTEEARAVLDRDRKSTRLNSSH